MRPQACGIEILVGLVVCACAWCKKKFGSKK